ncbi:hypothetical protein SAMN05192560_1378 [Methylobacillus rhizosphaerae]|uniref:Uncharacterized protein n=1 Tax=Methylobacillus rhizosphaerae TaxID=551994 RepID=A0A238ZMM1_9PROT|nr:hypothetical protein [Methylobacillus rhizosphaerae]SNR84617.1 hypothetical protein SAMN05192560_1378 [Methylobacillus rhizosphaerae]
MKSTPRQWLLWAALLTTLGATLWLAISDDDDTNAIQVSPPHSSPARVPQPRAAAADVKVAGSGSLDMARLQRNPWPDSKSDLFSSGQPASLMSAQEAAAMPQPVMEVPPVPFTYAGRIEDHGELSVFLAMGDKNLSVKVGDVIGDWKVREITSSRMMLTYQPLRVDVPLMIGEHN